MTLSAVVSVIKLRGILAPARDIRQKGGRKRGLFRNLNSPLVLCYTSYMNVNLNKYSELYYISAVRDLTFSRILISFIVFFSISVIVDLCLRENARKDINSSVKSQLIFYTRKIDYFLSFTHYLCSGAGGGS